MPEGVLTADIIYLILPISQVAALA